MGLNPGGGGTGVGFATSLCPLCDPDKTKDDDFCKCWELDDTDVEDEE